MNWLCWYDGIHWFVQQSLFRLFFPSHHIGDWVGSLSISSDITVLPFRKRCGSRRSSLRLFAFPSFHQILGYVLSLGRGCKPPKVFNKFMDLAKIFSHKISKEIWNRFSTWIPASWSKISSEISRSLIFLTTFVYLKIILLKPRQWIEIPDLSRE